MAEENIPEQEAQKYQEAPEVAKKIEAAAAVRDAEEFLRGRKQVKVIKKSAIKDIIDALIAQYEGMEHKDLLGKMAEYELKLADLNQERETLLPLAEKGRTAEPRITELEELVEKSKGGNLEREKELEEKLKRLEELMAGDNLKKRLHELETKLALLESKVKELMLGLEYVAPIEELDYGEGIAAAEEQIARIIETEGLLTNIIQNEPDNKLAPLFSQFIPEIRTRDRIFVDVFKEHNVLHPELIQKMNNNEGSIDVIVELIRMFMKSKWYRRELEIYNKIIACAELVAGK
ncbi:MAG: hypothetical protein ABIH42_05055 [Planctomycetota bacterium]